MALIGGQYRATPVTYSDKDIVEALPTDANGNLMVNLAAGEEINVGTLTLGTINMLRAGTISSGTINAGTIGGKAASGAASVANPVQIAGTDAGGTVYSPLINTAGAGTMAGVGTLPGIGVVTTVTNVSNGTIQNSGTVTGVGVITSVTGIESGTINNSGSTTGVGVVSALTSGTVSVNTPGTITSGTVSVNTPGTITSGSISVIAGTVNSGTINAGTINSGTINAGTMNTGTLNAGTINAGTFRDDGRPARNILSFGTTIAFGGSAFATLVGSAAVGAGTSIWVNDVSIVNNGGTQKYGLVFGSAINGSAVIAKGQFGPQSDVQKSFPMPVNAGMTNFDLNAWAEGAGTADFVVSYFISA